MTETSSSEVPTASLVGALSVFPLNDILSLLAETGQNGELQVVGRGVDGHLWVDGKDLVGATLDGAKSITQAVFEMILLDEGWFYFTSDQAPPAGQVRHKSISSVISEVVPQVQEWRDLLQRVPLDSDVRMARTTPGPEVQIRSDQWRVLTAVGTSGKTVRSVVEELEDDSVVTVRLLRELADSGLLVIGDDPAAASKAPVQTEASATAVTAAATETQAPASVGTDIPDSSGSVPLPPPGFVSASPGSAAPATSPSISSVPGMSTEYGTEAFPVVPPPVTADPWAPPGSRV
jgi:hypothetical protein